MTIEELVRDLHCRGVVFEPCGDKLAVDPIEKLGPTELDAIQANKREILRLFHVGRFECVECPGAECDQLLLVIDGMAYCHRHRMSVRFVETPQ